jgi:hypothetical protein
MRTKQANFRPSVARLVGGMRTLPGFRSYPSLYVASAWKARHHRADLAGVRSFLVFVGHPRSGHSLVGSLLDAHPNMVVAHELDVGKYVDAGYHRDQLLTLVLEHSAANAAAGRRSWGYSYAVPGQWQGRYDRLEVVGDKRGRMTTARLHDDPTLLDRLEDRLDLPVKVVQVVRNPYDDVATMHRRAGDAPMSGLIEEYFALSATVDAVASGLAPERLHRLRLEALVADTRSELAALCGFLGVDPAADAGYLDACASIVFASPRRTRDDAPWTPELRAAVAQGIGRHTWLAGYTFD